MKFTRDNLIFLGAVAAMVAAAVLVVYRPQGRKLDQIRAEIAATEEAFKQDSQRAAVVPSLLREIEAMKHRYTGFEQKLPKNQDLGAFLGEITSYLNQEKLGAAEIEPKSPLAGELYHTLPILMRCEGSYLSLASFLQRLDTMQRVTRVHTLRIGPSPKGDVLQVEMQLNIYFTES